MSLDTPEFASSIAQSNPPIWAGLRRSAFLLLSSVIGRLSFAIRRRSSLLGSRLAMWPFVFSSIVIFLGYLHFDIS